MSSTNYITPFSNSLCCSACGYCGDGGPSELNECEVDSNECEVHTTMHSNGSDQTWVPVGVDFTIDVEVWYCHA